MKKKVLIGFIGLSRTFKEASKNIKKNIIDNNRNNFDFTICVNTDLSNINRYSSWRKTQLPQENSLDKTTFENDIYSVYNTNNELKHISYFTIKDIHTSGPSLLKKRASIIFDKEKDINYDLYIFIRMDCIITKPILLHEFLSSRNKHKFSLITGGSKNTTRSDHCYDWDYCWIGDKHSIQLWIKGTFSKFKRLSYDELINISNIIKLKGRYVSNVKIQKYLYNNWAINLWETFYNMYLERCEISFATEEKNIFCEILRD